MGTLRNPSMVSWLALSEANKAFSGAAGLSTYTYFSTLSADTCMHKCKGLASCTVFSYGDSGCCVPVAGHLQSAVGMNKADIHTRVVKALIFSALNGAGWLDIVLAASFYILLTYSICSTQQHRKLRMVPGRPRV